MRSREQASELSTIGVTPGNMTRHLRDQLASIVDLPEAGGVTLDVRRGTKHWHVIGTLGEIRRRVCVVALGSGKSDPNAQKRLNYLTGARRALRTLRAVAEA